MNGLSLQPYKQSRLVPDPRFHQISKNELNVKTIQIVRNYISQKPPLKERDFSWALICRLGIERKRELEQIQQSYGIQWQMFQFQLLVIVQKLRKHSYSQCSGRIRITKQIQFLLLCPRPLASSGQRARESLDKAVTRERASRPLYSKARDQHRDRRLLIQTYCHLCCGCSKQHTRGRIQR